MQVILDDVEGKRAEWKELRRGKITATKIVTILGLNPYDSELRQWAIDTGKIDDDFEGNDFTDAGTALEPLVGKKYSKKYSVPIVSANCLVQHPVFHQFVASPDFWQEDQEDNPEKIVEAKTFASRQLEKWSEDECPYPALLQLQWQMACCGISDGAVAGMNRDDPSLFFTPQFPYDPSLFEMMAERASEYLLNVREDIPPNAGAGDAKLIQQLIGVRSKEMKIFSDEEAYRISELLMFIDQLKEDIGPVKDRLESLEAMKKAYENQIRQFVGKGEAGKMPDGRIIKLSTVNNPGYPVKPFSYERLSIQKVKSGK